MGRKRRIVVFLIALVSVFGLSAGSASAKWGPYNECWIEIHGDESHHCYALEEWTMSGYPREYGNGAIGLFDTTYIGYIPYPGAVTHEVWVSFPGNENYVEIGQIFNNGDTAPHPFFSSTKNGAQYSYFAPYTYPMNTYNWFEVSDRCHCSRWEFFFYGNLVKIDYGYPWWNKEVQVGMEAATGHEPHAAGRDLVASIEPPSNYLTELMSGYGNHSWPWRNGGLCVGRNPESGHWGNLIYSTCKSGTQPYAQAASNGPDAAPTLSEIEAGPPEMVEPAFTPPGGKELSAKAAQKKALKYAKKFGSETQVTNVAAGSLEGAQAALDPAEPTKANLAAGEAEASVSPLAAPAATKARPTGVQGRVARTRTYVVVMKGNFVSPHVMHGKPQVKGTTMALIEDAHTGQIEGYFVGTSNPDLSELTGVGS